MHTDRLVNAGQPKNQTPSGTVWLPAPRLTIIAAHLQPLGRLASPDAQLMTLPEPVQVRLGPPTASDPTPAAGTLAWPDLDPTHRPGDWPALLQRLASLVPVERPILLVRAGIQVPKDVSRQLRVLAQGPAATAAIIAPLSNLEPDLAPLPPGTTMTAPLAIDDIDRCCAWLGREALFDHDRPMAGCALWQAGSARRLLDAGWSPGENLPAGFSCLISERLFAGDPDRNLVGPPVWPVNDIPPPVHPLDRLRARWPLAPGPDQRTRTLPGTSLALADLAGVVPDGPVPGRAAVPVVLHICHGWGGGSLRFIQDLAGADDGRCHLLLSAHGDSGRQQYGEWLELRPARAGNLLLARFRLHLPITDTVAGHDGYSQVLAQVLARWQIDAVMVSSLIGHSLEALATGLPTVWLCHDYYPLWPQLHCDFGDGERRFDRDELDRTLASARLELFRNHDADHWWLLRQQAITALLKAGADMVAPTRQVMANWRRLAPELATLEWHWIAHGIPPWPAVATSPEAGSGPARIAPQAAPVDRHGRLRVLVPGRIAGGKGMDLLPSLLDQLDRLAAATATDRDGHGIELILLGAGSTGEHLHGRSGVHIVADYQRDELPGHLSRLQPDLALLPATVAETFGYLLSELRSLALPVLATAIGSYLERIDDGADGLLVEPDAGAIARRLIALRDDPSELAAIRQRLARQPIRDLAAMAADYQPLLPIAAGRPIAALDRIDLATMAEADLGRQLLELGQRLARMRAELSQGKHELQRRADWGFNLARQLDESKQWALSLDRQVTDLDSHVLRLHEELEERTQWAQSLDRQIGELHALVNERTAWAQDLDGQLRRLQQQAGELRENLDLILGSRSWRLMAPARVLARQARALRAKAAFQARRLGNLSRRCRLSLATRGLVGTWQHLRGRRRSPLQVPDHALQAALAAPPSTLPTRLPDSDSPLVSIIIPVYGKLEYTLACLASLAEHAGATPIEIIVVDDASPDGSAEILAGIPGLHLIRNRQNLGFIGSCNAGAAAARGRWLLFLNNDTKVTAGWLEAMLATFDDFDRAGLVGARLVYPDGRLQEAGGLVFSDGSGWNYGRFGDPGDPAYSYARATDYCSGAAILLAKELFDRLGGFDTRYAPAYYEDTDLAFKVRQAGLQVIYQPAATVIHFEGVTSGTDTASGVKQYQVVNQGKFLEAWREQLPKQPAPGTPVERIVRQAPKGRVLVIDATTPEPDQDSGSVRLLNLLRLLRDSGRHVTFFADNKAYVPGHSQRLQRMGIEVLHHPWLGHPADWLREHGPDLGAVLVCRHYIAANYIELVREYAPKARFIFDTVDLHYLREERAATLADSNEIRRQAGKTRQQEQRLIRDSDITLVVSPAEQALLAQELPDARVEVLSNVHPVPGRRRGFDERRDLIFVGGFQHPPNVDAVLWFAEQVLPRVRKALPDVRAHIIGSKMPPAISALDVPGLEVHGFVADLEPFLDGCRIALAPLRYGAGVKGKVNMSMSYGQPVVATTVAAEGMHLVPGSDILVADSADLFAAQIVRLYRNPELWLQLSEAGMDNVRQHFSFDAARRALERILEH